MALHCSCYLLHYVNKLDTLIKVTDPRFLLAGFQWWETSTIIHYLYIRNAHQRELCVLNVINASGCGLTIESVFPMVTCQNIFGLCCDRKFSVNFSRIYIWKILTDRQDKIYIFYFVKNSLQSINLNWILEINSYNRGEQLRASSVYIW